MKQASPLWTRVQGVVQTFAPVGGVAHRSVTPVALGVNEQRSPDKNLRSSASLVVMVTLCDAELMSRWTDDLNHSNPKSKRVCVCVFIIFLEPNKQK